MLKKTVTYTDFDGVERTEDFYFNFTEAECTEMQFSEIGGLSNLLQKIVEEKRSDKLIEYFKKIVINAYGEKSLDGKKFIKNDRIREEFECCAAYSKIFMELAFDDVAAAEFINGVMPATLENTIDEKAKALPGKAPIEVAKPTV